MGLKGRGTPELSTICKEYKVELENDELLKDKS